MRFQRESQQRGKNWPRFPKKKREGGGFEGKDTGKILMRYNEIKVVTN